MLQKYVNFWWAVNCSNQLEAFSHTVILSSGNDLPWDDMQQNLYKGMKTSYISHLEVMIEK